VSAVVPRLGSDEDELPMIYSLSSIKGTALEPTFTLFHGQIS
jgi:hypothetical protein